MSLHGTTRLLSANQRTVSHPVLPGEVRILGPFTGQAPVGLFAPRLLSHPTSLVAFTLPGTAARQQLEVLMDGRQLQTAPVCWRPSEVGGSSAYGTRGWRRSEETRNSPRFLHVKMRAWRDARHNSQQMGRLALPRGCGVTQIPSQEGRGSRSHRPGRTSIPAGPTCGHLK